MKKQEIYNAWKEKNRQIGISENFADGVMKQIYQHERKRRESLFNMRWFVGFISGHPFAQAALIAVGAITGLVRVAFVIHILLF